MCCAGGTAPWAARSRRHPPWAPSCAASWGQAGPGETGLGRWGRTRRRAVHHRPRFHHLRDLRTGQGGRPPPRLTGRGYHPLLAIAYAPETDVPAARGPGQHRPRRRPLPATVGRVRYASADSRYGPTAGSHGPYPSAAMSASPSPASTACAISLRRCGMPGLPFPAGVSLTPHRCGSSSGV